MKAFLKSSDGVFMLRSKVTTIGRHEDSDLVLKSVGIEDHHAVIEFSDSENSFVLQDFNSLHGTFVNDCHIQNAAVKVGAGDVLRFGSGGISYELVIENTSQMSCPPMKRRTAWPGQLQLIAETKLYTPSTAPPQLPSLHSQHPSSIHNSWMPGTNGTTPHPPNRKRPVSAWGRSMTSSFSPDTFNRTTAVRQGNGQSGASGVPLSGIHHMDLLLQEKDDIILKMEDKINHLLGFENESKYKDTMIANLQDEIAVMTKKMAQAAARNDVEFTQKLQTFERDIEAKTEEIKVLKEQISNLQRDSSQVMCHSLSERDLEIANLKKEGEKLRRNQVLTTGLVTSLQRDISAKEQKILQLKLNADKLKKENREKDNQLAVVSAKRIGELELQVKGLQGELQKYCTEQEITTNRLAEKTKAEQELRKECEKKCLQLQEVWRREGLVKADLELAKAQLECFKKQMIEIFYSQEAEIPETITDQQLMEKIRQITDENLQIHEEEKLLQEEISSKDSEEKEESESVEVLKKSLDELQAFLRTSYCSNGLKREICNLQDLCIGPSVLWIHTSVIGILSSLLSWVETVEQLVQDVGIDMSCSDKGMASYMKNLLKKNHETVSRIQTLQAQLDKLQESQNSLLQEKLHELKAEHEKELQDKIKLMLSEKEEENKKILDSAVAQETDKLKESVEEEKKKVQHLENQWKYLTEVIELKMKEEEIVNAKLKEAVDSLEEARKREAMLQERLLMQDKHLTLIQDENELLKQKVQKEIMEYKEQIKQHSQTIVALEDRLLEATQHQKNIEEENIALQEKVEMFQKAPQKSASSASQELSDNEEAHILMVELAAARKEILSKQATILELKRDLSEAKARMSDMIGELSEKQKMELEQNLILVRSQESELNMLREKLSEMSDLVDKKNKDLRTSHEELRHAKEKLEKLKNAAKEKESEFEKLPHTDVQASTMTKDEVPKTKKKQTLDLEDLGAKCKGLRHEEIIQRQKDALTELRDRIKMLEKTQSLTFKEKVPEPLIVLKKDLSEKIAQKIGLEKERVPSSIKKMEAKLPSHFPNTCSNIALERTAKLEMSDALDVSEKMYLNLIHALGSLMNVKELAGVQSVKHLSQDEREKVGMQRQKDLELLYDKISKLKSRLERKEELLKEYESDVEQLRANKVSLQAYQAEVAKLEDEVYKEAEENALLKEALERTQFQLNQEKRLNRAVKLHKSHLEELEKRSEKLSPCYTCSQKDRARKPGSKTKPFPEKLKTTDDVIETFKKRAHSNATS